MVERNRVVRNYRNGGRLAGKPSPELWSAAMKAENGVVPAKRVGQMWFPVPETDSEAQRVYLSDD